MNTRHISAIAFKLFAIYIIVSAVISMPIFFGMFVATRNFHDGAEVGLIWPLTIASLTLVVALIAFSLLWRLGNSVLHHSAALLDPADDIDQARLEKMLFVLLGIYFSVSAATDIPAFSATVWSRMQTDTGMGPADYAWLISLGIQLLIGLSLIARWPAWLGFIRRLGVN